MPAMWRAGVLPDLAVSSAPRRSPISLDATAITNMRSGLTEPLPTKISISSQGWTSAEALVKRGKRFKLVKRVSAVSSEAQVSLAIQEHDQFGEPLIIEKLHQKSGWIGGIFNIEWLLKHGEQGAYLLRMLFEYVIDLPCYQRQERVMFTIGATWICPWEISSKNCVVCPYTSSLEVGFFTLPPRRI